MAHKGGGKTLFEVEIPSLDKVNKTVNKAAKSVQKKVGGAGAKASSPQAKQSSPYSKVSSPSSHSSSSSSSSSTAAGSLSPRGPSSSSAPPRPPKVSSPPSHSSPAGSLSPRGSSDAPPLPPKAPAWKTKSTASPSKSGAAGRGTSQPSSSSLRPLASSAPSIRTTSQSVAPSHHTPSHSSSSSHRSAESQLKSWGTGLNKEANKAVNSAQKRLDGASKSATNAEFDKDPKVVMAQWGIPPRKLMDRGFLSGVHEGNEVLRIQNVSIHTIKKRHKTLMSSGGVLTAHRTNHEQIAIFKYSGGGRGYRFISNTQDKACLRPYRFHYVLTDENHQLFLLELHRATTIEDMEMLEMMFAYYTYFHRMHGIKPGEESKVKSGVATKPLNLLANGIETGTHKVADVCVTAGVGIAKGAHKVSEKYQHNAKAYDGDRAKDREKLMQMKEKETSEKQAEKASQGLAKSTDAVFTGVKDGFKYVGSRAKKGANAAAAPVKDTEWYKKKEEKAEQKKKEEEQKGIVREPGVGVATVEVVKAGWNGVKTIKDGIGQGISTGATGIRDAKVEATRHTDGDYEAEKTKGRWNTAGNVVTGVFNIWTIFKTVGTIWVSGAIWAAGGAINYDIDKAELLGGAPWKEGWLLWRNGIYAGGSYELYWVVLTQHTMAMFAKPNDPKPEKYFKLRGFRGIDKADKTVADKNYTFVITRSQLQFFSTEHLPDPQQQLENWMDLLWSLSEFHVPTRVLKKEKKDKDKVR